MRSLPLIFLFLILLSSTSRGETYKYRDDKGTPCFTDDIKSIPKKYRKNAVVVKDDDGKVAVAPPPQADRIDESLLPQKEDAVFRADTSSVHAPLLQNQDQGFPYLNVAVISSIFLGALISGVFVDNRMFKKILNIVSLASILTLLFYVSTFFASRHMHTLKKASTEMTDTMKKKEAQKEKAIQEVLEGDRLGDERRH